MRKHPRRDTRLLWLATAGLLAILASGSASGQENPVVNLKVQPVSLPVGSLSYRAMRLAGSKAEAPSTSAFKHSGHSGQDEIPAIEAPGFYPADVSNPANQPAIVSTQHHPIYVNNVPSHWGDVGGFLTDLGKSNFIHVLDQYAGASANNRYTLGTSFLAVYPIPSDHTLLIGDILALVHAGALITGNGFGHMYHVFLPDGVDMCLPPPSPNAPPPCYSPDNPDTFIFCAFHGSVSFNDAAGHVIFSLEPYQNVPGCSVPPTGTANNQLLDSTDNVLSHEVSEAISDPDGVSWWVQNFTFAFGAEIGDLCIRAAVFSDGNVYWDYGRVKLNGHPYTIQPEYSNQVHGCTYKPQGED